MVIEIDVTVTPSSGAGKETRVEHANAALLARSRSTYFTANYIKGNTRRVSTTVHPGIFLYVMLVILQKSIESLEFPRGFLGFLFTLLRTQSKPRTTKSN